MTAALSASRTRWAAVAVTIGCVTVGCAGSRGPGLEQATRQARDTVGTVHDAVQATGLFPSEVTVTEDRDCTDQSGRLDGTAERAALFTVTVANADEAEQVVTAALPTMSGMSVRKSTDPETGRPVVVGSVDGRQVSVTFSVYDGGRTATVSASTGCRPV